MPFAAAVAGVGLAVQSRQASKARKSQEAAARDSNAIAQETSDQQIELQRDQFNRTEALQREQLNRAEALQRESMNRDRQIYDTAREDSRLGREIGQGALRQYWTDAVDKGFQFDPNAFATDRIMNDPGMKFRLDQGNKSAMRSINAGPTGTYSGAAAKALLDYNQGAASQEYGAAYGRAADGEARRKDEYQLRINQLGNLAGIGQTSNQAAQVAGQNFGQAGQNSANALNQAGQNFASGVGGAGQNFASGAGNALGNYGNTAGSNAIGLGNARASNSLYQGNSWGNAFNQAGSALGRRGGFGNLLGGGGGNPYGGYFSTGAGSTGWGGGSVQGNSDYQWDL
jgi:hypothetical protein